MAQVKRKLLNSERRASSSSSQRPSFYRGVTFTGLGTALNIVFLFLETMIAARMLSTSDFGTYILLIVIVNFLVIAIDFGFKTSTTQLIASSEPARQTALVNNVVVFRLLVIALVSPLILLGRRLVFLVDPSQMVSRYVAYIPLMLVFASLDELFLAMLQGFQAYRQMAAAQALRSVLRLCLSTFFIIVLGSGALGLVYSWIFSFALSAVYMYMVLPVSRRLVWDGSLLREVVRFGAPLQMNRFLWFASGRLDTLLLGVLIGPSAVAFFNVAARIPNALYRLSEAYFTVYFPTVTSLLSAGKREQAVQLLGRSLRLISFSIGLGVLFSILFSREIVTILFSAKYVDSALTFAILMLALHMMVVVNLMGYTLTSAGFPGRALGTNLFRTVLAFLANLVLIPLSGFTGSAYASLVAYYMANPLSVWLLRRSDVRVEAAPYVKQTVLLLLGVALFWWARLDSLVYRAAILVFFVGFNIMLSTISFDDLWLVLPEMVTKRLRIRKEIPSNGC